MLSGRAQELSRNLYSPAMRYFLAAAEAGSIRAASRELNVASSAVNRQILWLEEAVGLQLFDRVGRRIRLSQAGELLLAHVRRTFSDFEGTVAELDALKGLRRGTVSIASVESVSEKLLPAVISSFRKSFPGIHVNVSVSSSQEAARKVETAEADVGFTFDPPENSALTVAFQQELVIGALMRPDHPLAKAENLDLEECLKFPVALPAEGLSLRTRLDMVRNRIAGVSRTYVEANSLRLMRALAREDGVIGFQTMIGCEDDLSSGALVFKPLTDAPLQADRLCVITSSLRALALAPGMFFDHSVLALKDRNSSNDAKKAS